MRSQQCRTPASLQNHRRRIARLMYGASAWRGGMQTLRPIEREGRGGGGGRWWIKMHISLHHKYNS